MTECNGSCHHDDDDVLFHTLHAGMAAGTATPAWKIAQEAYAQLAQRHMGLVKLVVRRFRRAVATGILDDDDLLQEGMIGLLIAIQRYDPGSPYRFSTYAMYWIRQSILRAIQNQSWMIRVPVHVQESQRILRRTEEHLWITNARTPSDQELASALQWPVAKVRQVRESRRQPRSLTKVSIDGTEYDDSDIQPVRSIFATDGSEGSDHSTMNVVALTTALRSLPPRLQEIIRLRYGLDGCQPHSLTELSVYWGISRARIFQLERRALHLLRDQLMAIASP